MRHFIKSRMIVQVAKEADLSAISLDTLKAELPVLNVECRGPPLWKLLCYSKASRLAKALLSDGLKMFSVEGVDVFPLVGGSFLLNKIERDGILFIKCVEGTRVEGISVAKEVKERVVGITKDSSPLCSAITGFYSSVMMVVFGQRRNQIIGILPEGLQKMSFFLEEEQRKRTAEFREQSRR